jgi:signal transduction histidine kinase
LVVGVALGAGGVGLLIVLRNQLVDNIDASLASRLDDLAANGALERLEPRLPASVDDGMVVQILGTDGAVVSQSRNIRDGARLGRLGPVGTKTVVRSVRHPPVGDGTAYRVAARAVTSGAGTQTVMVAASLEPAEEGVAAVRRVLFAAVPALLGLVAAVTWVVVGRALAPVESMRRAVAAISMAALDQRVPEPATRDEIGRLARTMNDMLARLQGANARQRAFVADASHELRTPLASVQTQLEVALANPEAGDWSGVARSVLAANGRIQQMVDALLFLAAADERQMVPTQTTVDIDELVLRAVEPIRARARLSVDISGVEGGRVNGDAGQLDRLVVNLLDNAERHAASRIVVSVRRVDGHVELVVSDDGPGVPPSERERVFGRFTRLDEARSRSRGGAGLGLAIVRDVVTRHGGSVAIVDGSPGAQFVVTLPIGVGDGSATMAT